MFLLLLFQSETLSDNCFSLVSLFLPSHPHLSFYPLTTPQPYSLPKSNTTMPTAADVERHVFYTNDLIPELAELSSFLGNLDFPEHFYTHVHDGQLANHSHHDTKTHQEKSFLVFGEVSSFDSGTKLSATGNHYKGKAGDQVCSISFFPHFLC